MSDVVLPGCLNVRNRSDTTAAAILPTMFVVTEADAAAIPAIFEQEGELSAAIEVRRRFPGITDNAKARECAPPVHRRLDAAAKGGPEPQRAAWP